MHYCRRGREKKEMGPLKSLEQDNPVIDQHFQAFCASHGILSVEDFLLYDIYALAAIAEEQPKPESERLNQGIIKVLSIIDGQRKPWLNGLELLEDAQRNKRVLSTGCEGIDMLLGGGLRQGQLTELVGPSSSGKTQVCLQSASNVAQNHRGRVVYLDTSNSFSPLRVARFIDPAEHNYCRSVMKNILCHSVFDIFTMFDVLHKLEFNLKSQLYKGAHHVDLLIIDSISSLITPILGGSGSQGHALMVSAGFLLKKLAYEQNIAVLVTNHTVGGEGGVPKPALGESWKSIPHTRLLLSRERGNNKCIVSIVKHSSVALGKSRDFLIRD